MAITVPNDRSPVPAAVITAELSDIHHNEAKVSSPNSGVEDSNPPVMHSKPSNRPRPTTYVFEGRQRMRHSLLLIGAILGSMSTALVADDQPSTNPWEVRVLGGIETGYNKGYPGQHDRIGSTGEVLALYHNNFENGPLGVVVGIGAFDDDRRAKEDTPDNITNYEAQGAVVTAGVTYDITKQLTIEGRVDGRAGEGRFDAQQTFSNGTFHVLGDYGRYYAGSAVAGVYYTFTNKISVGIEAGYDTFQGKSNYINNDLTLRGDGLVARLGAGYHF
jgi:hypothetical protein